MNKKNQKTIIKDVTKPSVINLSNYKLTEDQIDLLKLGLKFCPTPKSNITELKEDVKDSERKVRLKELFGNKENKDDSLVKNKSKFQPTKGNKDIDTFFQKIWNLEFKDNSQIRNNLSHKQKLALEELRNNENIIIKEADKGGAVIIMEREYYREKIQEMLNNETNFQLLEGNRDTKIIAKIKKLCEKYENQLTKKEMDYLVDFDAKTSNFYGLPKIHKSEEIKKAVRTQKSSFIETPNPGDLKFRPIIAGPESPTNRLCDLTDKLLQPFLQKVRSYVKDNIHFLNQLPDKIEPNTILTTFDVTSLYSNIPHELGKQAILYWTNKHPELLHPRFNGEFIVESLELILENNTFQFNDKDYLQILGTAMGAKMAPTYATLTLAYLEEKLYEEIGTKYGDHIKAEFIESWKRYLDDCFILWKSSWGDIKDLYQTLQNMHPNINFTIEYSYSEIPFLDIMVINKNGKVITDIYRKPTDTQQYLHFKSDHPKNCIKSVPYTLARRICTIINDPILKRTRLDELHQSLSERKYPTPIIREGIRKVENIPLSELRKPRIKKTKDPLTFVSTFNKNNPEIFPEIKKNLQHLENNATFKKILDNTELINSKRQPKNLKRMLTAAKFNKNHNTGVKKCGDKRCKVCEILIEGNTFKFKNTAKEFEIRKKLTCTSKNVIYAMVCDSCGENYVGKTQEFNKRIAKHRSDIKIEANRCQYVSHHIADCGKSNFKIMPILQSNSYTRLGILEENIIERFKPTLNRD